MSSHLIDNTILRNAEYCPGTAYLTDKEIPGNDRDDQDTECDQTKRVKDDLSRQQAVQRNIESFPYRIKYGKRQQCIGDEGDGFLFDGFDNVEFVLGGTDNGCNGCNSNFDAVDFHGAANEITAPDNLPFKTNDDFIQTSISDGGRFGVVPFRLPYSIDVPDGYVSGAPYAGSSTYANSNFATFGLISGRYTWTWGADANADSITLQVGAVGGGDYDRDCKSDILWRNTATGQNWMYLMDGATISSSTVVNTVSDLNWKIMNVD